MSLTSEGAERQQQAARELLLALGGAQRGRELLEHALALQPLAELACDRHANIEMTTRNANQRTHDALQTS